MDRDIFFVKINEWIIFISISLHKIFVYFLFFVDVSMVDIILTWPNHRDLILLKSDIVRKVPISNQLFLSCRLLKPSNIDSNVQ